ncbi:MAG TPA: cation diffusion facilitator family transporter [Rickettsiales bacterium]|nr:cation diffusion facilitator family transporter [Rickettsiales bacterium]
MENNHCHHCHKHEVTSNTIRSLYIAFSINMLLTLVEIITGILAESIALIGDGLHNTSDAFSILIAIIAFKISTKKADEKYSFGFKRAETIGGFVNLILLFISGIYLFFEGISRIVKPEFIDGKLIVYVSVLALIIDIATAKLTHQHSHGNTNMKMLFIHNLADALGSVGVIISGLFVVFFGWNFVDGVIALFIASYMIFQSIINFPQIINILMNSKPDNISLDELKDRILSIKDVCDIHHIHLWNISEKDVSFECHIVTKNKDGILQKIQNVLKDEFNITHSNIQIEDNLNCNSECRKCNL